MLLSLLFCSSCGTCSDLGETLRLKEQLEGVRSRLSPRESRHSDSLGPSPAGLSRSQYFWCRLLNTAHGLAPLQTLHSNTVQSEFSRIHANSETVRSYEQNMKVKYRSWVDTVTLGGYGGHAHQLELQWHPTGDGDKKINVWDTFWLHMFPAQLPTRSLSMTVDVRTNKTGKKSKREWSQPSGTKTPYLERACEGPLLVRVKWQ